MNTTNEQTNTTRNVARAAILVMAAFALSRILGLVRQMAFTTYFGTGMANDAYEAALKVPDTIFMVVAGGALGSAFIPLFTSRVAKGEPQRAWRLSSAIITNILLIIVPLSLLCMIFAPWLMRVALMPGASIEAQALAVKLVRIMLVNPVIFGVSGIIMGSLNGFQHFLLPALTSSVYNLGLIAGAIIGGNTSLGIIGPAIGAVAGAVGHLLIQLPGLLKFKAHYTSTLDWRDPDVRKVAALMGPRVLSMAAWQLNQVVATSLASAMPVGAISAINIGWRVMLLPQGILASAVGTAVFPTFSEQAALGQYKELRDTLTSTLRSLIVLILPATVGLILLGEPIVRLLFMRGEFDADSVRGVTWALACYSIGLMGHSAQEILKRVFFAMQNTWIPVIVAIIAVVLNIILGLALPPVFANYGAPAHAGLALATAIAALTEMVLLLLLINKRVQGLEWAGLLNTTGRATLASIGMGVALWLWNRIAPASALFDAGIGIVVGMVVYALLAFVLRIEEVKQLIDRILGIVKRKLSSVGTHRLKPNS